MNYMSVLESAINVIISSNNSIYLSGEDSKIVRII